MDDYLAQTDRTLRSLTSLEQSKASSATLNYAQGEAARAAGRPTGASCRSADPSPLPLVAGALG